jgi:bifunctional non-homologous end joining protein LigD
MKGVSGALPTDDGWGYEIKWDGMRVVAEVDGAVTAHSANGLDATDRFPELQGLAGHLAGHRAVLDGEVVVLDDLGRADFGRLQQRMHVSRPDKVAALRGDHPVTFVVFDLLHLDDTPTIGLPYADRRALLVELVEPGPGWLVPDHQVGHGKELFDAAAATGLEGVMAKRLDSRYLPGQRSAAWRKVKVRRRQELVIGGWTAGTGGRAASLGALLVGVHDPAGGPLRFAGGVGTGFTDQTLALLQAELATRTTDDCPFEPPPPRTALRTPVTWVRPELVAEVAFGEWTADGRVRHGSYLGLRTDKDPSTVVREPQP